MRLAPGDKVDRCCIVGHGPSLKGAGRGGEIDACDVVVRVKHSAPLLGPDFGERTDVAAGTTASLAEREDFPDAMRWLFCKRHDQIGPGLPPRIGTLGWFYTGLRQFKSGKWADVFVFSGDDARLQLKNLRASCCQPSIGAFAAMAAMDMFRVRQLVLAGFDSLMAGDLPGPTISALRGIRPGSRHDWLAEKRMLGNRAREMGVHLCAL